jgi:uncharacterized membrane protein
MASPNPIGRIYAIEAISNGNVNNIRKNKIYSNIINKIIKLNIPIKAGAACFSFEMSIDSYKNINEAMNFIGSQYDYGIKSYKYAFKYVIGGIIIIIGIVLIIKKKKSHTSHNKR